MHRCLGRACTALRDMCALVLRWPQGVWQLSPSCKAAVSVGLLLLPFLSARLLFCRPILLLAEAREGSTIPYRNLWGVASGYPRLLP